MGFDEVFRQLRQGEYDHETLRVLGTWSGGVNRRGIPDDIRDPNLLRGLFIEYMTFCEINPLYEGKATKYGHSAIPKKRIISGRGFCVYIGKSSSWLMRAYNRARERGDEEFMEVVSWIMDVVNNDKYEGAAAGLYSPSFVAKDLSASGSADAGIGGSRVETKKLPSIKILTVGGYTPLPDDEVLDDSEDIQVF